MRRRYGGPWQIKRAWQQQWEARNLPAPYDKNGTHPSSVRRPKSGTWQSVAMGDSSNGRPFRDP
ncbi:unnamed protein product [Staurois parvus]|uniref:Transposase n=1 Tax=Staurois parvus TaxID=386267 RepID=A0ABN9AW96_9NEOB|nr:unnamed protein product [Staurois parvus]